MLLKDKVRLFSVILFSSFFVRGFEGGGGLVRLTFPPLALRALKSQGRRLRSAASLDFLSLGKMVSEKALSLLLLAVLLFPQSTRRVMVLLPLFPLTDPSLARCFSDSLRDLTNALRLCIFRIFYKGLGMKTQAFHKGSGMIILSYSKEVQARKPEREEPPVISWGFKIGSFYAT